MNLEKLVQKHEAEIRNHVRTEQQLRLYIEALENDEQGKKTQFHTLEDALKVGSYLNCRNLTKITQI